MPSISFAREHRLKSSFRIRKAFREGKKARGEFISVFWHQTKEDEVIRFATVISSKTEKHAVRRNRMKRLLRESFTKNMKQFRINAEGDWVLLVQRVPRLFELEIIERDVLGCLNKLLSL